MIKHPAPDHIFKGVSYRLRPDIRDRSDVRPAAGELTCHGCARPIKPATRYVRTPTITAHPHCAIGAGLLVKAEGGEGVTSPQIHTDGATSR